MAASALGLALLVVLLSHSAEGIRPLISAADERSFAEAPHFRNGDSCPRLGRRGRGRATLCDPSHVHIAMTLDSRYLRGTVAAVHSLLWHASCPDHLFLHFVTSSSCSNSSSLHHTIRSTFPFLRFKIYPFNEDLVRGLISPSVRAALESPLNYARTYLADLLEPCVDRVIYLDSDLVVVDDVRHLWDVSMPAPAVIAAPEYCHANFTRYFTPTFWESDLHSVFLGRRHRPCYFNTGVMVMDLKRWRAGGYREKIEKWMRVQKEKRIYELGSLPPFLLAFAGEVEGVEHRWNQHGLGGDNVGGNCRELHPGPSSLLHWSGKGKPWDRLDEGKPCPVDHLWAAYDLYRPNSDATSANPIMF